MEYLHNNKEKIEKLSEFMKELLNNTNESKGEIYEKYKEYILSVTPMDIFYLDMYNQESKLNIEEIKNSADRFVNVFHQGLAKHEIKEYKHDFFKLLYLESKAIETALQSLKPLIKKNMTFEDRMFFVEKLKDFNEINVKYIKIQNILFPHLENKLPSNKPIQVLWDLHDDTKRLNKQLIELLNKESFDQKEFFTKIGEYFFLIYGINHKEQLILYPVAVKLLSDNELNLMYNEMLEYGFAFMENIYLPKKLERINVMNIKNHVFNSVTGELDFKNLEIILNILPIDITFVDKENKVKYYNDTKNRVFPRNPSIIGRDVENCHPKKSVEVVERIIDSFRKGIKDEADFWLNFNQRMIYINYLALRDSNNNYIGVLEVSQDITDFRNLEGERRLLDWD